MRRKKYIVRVLTRILYAGGIVLLTAGLMLSAFSSPAAAAELSGVLKAGPGSAQDPYPYPGPGDETPDPEPYPPPLEPTATFTQQSPTDTPPPDQEELSSLVFSSACTCGCENVQTRICNLGGDMQASASWTLFRSSAGNPSVNGVPVASGTIQPLAANECVDLNTTPEGGGIYAYRLEQEAAHVGPDVLWSYSCIVGSPCGATPTYTSTPPGVEVTETLTSTPPGIVITETPGEPTLTRTPRPPLEYNLSAVCGYVGESGLLWKVANNTGQDVDYTWQVVGSDESDSGSVEANGEDYFVTSSGDKTVRLLVDGEVVDTQPSEPPCKEAMVLSFICPDGDREWYVNNPNDFGVDYTWQLESGATGSGMLPGGARVRLAVTEDIDDRMTFTWTDTRPGTHTVSLEAEAGSCPDVDTATPTVTNTPPQTVITFTPTVTNTPPQTVITFTPTVTRTPTVTNTPPQTVITFTPTVTNTPPQAIITFTATSTLAPTITNTPPQAVITFTNTPTVTNTPPQAIITFTATSINTLPPPVSFVTSTPVLIPVTGADMTGAVGASSLSLFGGMLTNTGLVLLGLAVALTAYGSQMKE